MENLKRRLENPGKEYRCDVRWWLAEGLHTDETLKQEVRTLAEDGFGAAEFLAIDELGADSSRYGWGSEEWVHDTETVIRETTENGLGTSMTSGTNWSNANLPDTVHTPDDPSAAKELDYTVKTLAPCEKWAGALEKATIRRPNVNRQELVAVVAAKKAGEANGRILLNAPQVLTGLVKGDCLEWTAPADGEYLLFALWLHGTGQTANPSVSVSYTVNYLDRYGIDKLTAYWDSVVLTPELRGYIRKNGRVQMYMDSLELSVYGQGGALWGYTMLDEFRARRGYDLTPYLPIILRRVHGMFMGPIDYAYDLEDAALAAKIRNDLYQTMTDLYIDNMLKPMQEWLHREGMTLRAEISYGLPFEISQPGKFVDGIETESLEFASQIDSYRGLAGVAHLYDKVYSSETGAAVMNYAMGLDFYTQIIFTQFAAGITRTVLHGYASIRGSEADTDWPGHEGMWPMFSERFGERQPAYRFYKDWTGMIARFQYLLRSGRPRRDIAILRLDYNFWNQVGFMGHMTGRTERQIYETALMRANEGIYWKDPNLQNAGFSYDYFAPQLLEDPDVGQGSNQVQSEGPGYQAVVVYQEELPLTSAKALLERARQGLPVVLVNGITETIQTATDRRHEKAALRTPYNDGLDGELASLVANLKALPNVREVDGSAGILTALEELGVEPRAGFESPNSKLFTLLREEGGWRYLYVYHYMYTDAEPCRATVRLAGAGVPYAVDCWTGQVTPLGLFDVQDGYTCIPVELRPGEARMYALDTGAAAGLHCVEVCGGCADEAADKACASVAAPDVTLQDGKPVLIARRSGDYALTLSDGSTRNLHVACREPIALERWNLTVESWSKGEKREITEDRGLGYVSKEVYFETSKTAIPVGETELMPWKDIPAVGPEVSGLGFYETTLTLPQDWGAQDGACLELGSTGGNAATVYVNGTKVEALDFSSRAVDISGLVRSGENALRVEVATPLGNKLRAIGYFDRASQISARLMKSAMGHGDEVSEGFDPAAIKLAPPVHDYGLLGEAWVRVYKRVEV